METHAAARMQPVITLGGLAACTSAMLAMVTWLSRSHARNREKTRRLLQTQAWQLRQLVPREAPVVTAMGLPAPYLPSNPAAEATTVVGIAPADAHYRGRS